MPAKPPDRAGGRRQARQRARTVATLVPAYGKAGIGEVTWCREPTLPEEREAWACELASILAGLPLPDVQRPRTHGAPRGYTLAQAKDPLSFRLGDTPYIGDAPRPAERGLVERSLLPAHRRARSQRLADELARKASGAAERSHLIGNMGSVSKRAKADKAVGAEASACSSAGEQAVSDEGSAANQAPTGTPSPVGIGEHADLYVDHRSRRTRPGTGGRQQRFILASETAATADLEAALGGPAVQNSGGVQMMSWTAERAVPGNGILDPAGDGMILGRLSSQDLQAGETIMGQVHGLIALKDRANLKAREILTTTRNSGYKPFEERQDFARVADEIAAGRVKWVGLRAPERVGRDLLTVLQFYKLLEDTGTDLYLTTLGRKVDWVEDRITLLALGMASEHEGRMIKDRTHGALKRRWLEEGRGWPTILKVGFRRNEHTKFLEVDPEQWPFIKQIHYGYQHLWGEDGHGGLRRLARELHESGFPISVDRLRRVLQDPMYVTGEWYCNYGGERIPCRPIELEEPIPADVFERNQQLLRMRRGRNMITPVGTFVLNRVRVLHARCMDEVVERDGRIIQPMLRARSWADGRKARVRPVYGHRPVPSCCRGYTIPASVLEKAVLRELRRLATSPELQAAWTAAAFPEVTSRREVLSGEQRAVLEQKRDNCARQLDRLGQMWSEQASGGEDLDPKHWERMTRPIQEQLDAIERQLSVLDAIAEARAATQPEAPDVDRETLVAKLNEILTDECPEDPELRLRRAAFVEAALSCVIIHDEEERPVTQEEAEGLAGKRAHPRTDLTRVGTFRIELRGPLIPAHVRMIDPWDPPLHAAQALIGSADVEDEKDEARAGDHRVRVADAELVEETESPAAAAVGRGSHTDCEVWTSQSGWEQGSTLSFDDDLRHDDIALGEVGAATRIYGKWRGRLLTQGRPAWRSPRLEGGAYYIASNFPQKTPDIELAINALAAALPSMATAEVKEMALGSLRPAYRAWRKNNLSHPPLDVIEKAAKSAGVTTLDLARAGQLMNDLGLGSVEALRRMRSEKRTLVTRACPEQVQEYWREEFDRVLAALMRVANRLPDKHPFGPNGYIGLWQDDPGLPSYPHLLFAARRRGFTPLQLLAHARELVARGVPPPEPVKREVVLTAADAPLGQAAIDEALEHPYTPADLRAASMTWPLHEVLDALVDAVPDLTPGTEWGPTGYKVLCRGRRDLPTDPTIKNVAYNHGLSTAQLLAAAYEARAAGRHLQEPDHSRESQSLMARPTPVGHRSTEAPTPPSTNVKHRSSRRERRTVAS
jgi:DNA invertase Pin-like site-specific DNA recombinase